jgi:hypothetical protein
MKSRKKFNLNNDIINYLKYIPLRFITGTIFEFYGIGTMVIMHIYSVMLNKITFFKSR